MQALGLQILSVYTKYIKIIHLGNSMHFKSETLPPPTSITSDDKT